MPDAPFKLEPSPKEPTQADRLHAAERALLLIQEKLEGRMPTAQMRMEIQEVIDSCLGGRYEWLSAEVKEELRVNRVLDVVDHVHTSTISGQSFSGKGPPLQIGEP